MTTTINSRKMFNRAALAGLALSAGLLAVACTKSTDPDGTPPPATGSREQLISMGDSIYVASCSGCHGLDGKGHSPHTPPVLHSDYLMEQRLRPMRILMFGLPNDKDTANLDTATTITVNGVDYVNQGMPAIGAYFTDLEMAAILTYIRAVKNDSSSVNCRTPIIDGDGNPQSDCDKVARAGAATDSVSIAEVAAYRAVLPEPE
jgi:mono/diheme cytochrome c family protein